MSEKCPKCGTSVLDDGCACKYPAQYAKRIAVLESALKHERRMVIGLASAFRAFKDGQEALDNLGALKSCRPVLTEMQRFIENGTVDDYLAPLKRKIALVDAAIAKAKAVQT